MIVQISGSIGIFFCGQLNVETRVVMEIYKCLLETKLNMQVCKSTYKHEKLVFVQFLNITIATDNSSIEKL